MKKRLTRNFFTRPTLIVAKDLLGKFLVRKFGNKILAGKVVETEAYLGPQDKASHGYRMKKTTRNKAEYLIGGHIYIYLVYGLYWQLNISTEKAGLPRCILIRALEPVMIKNKTLNKKKITNGPGKLCQWLKLNQSFYGEDLIKSQRIWLEDCGIKIKREEIAMSKRIGIDYAGRYWANRKLRFYLKNNPFVSKI
ncbi:MAG: DNA-3-methyladenine glycosylase [Patescibacteria group bacterium]|nr:DNA-3-methyladenine glycosylase [Patescibacteria group bacterium]